MTVDTNDQTEAKSKTTVFFQCYHYLWKEAVPPVSSKSSCIFKEGLHATNKQESNM